MRRALVGASLGVALLGCAGARPARLPPTSGDEVRSAGAASLVVLTRPLAARLRVQLWIDAGAIDAAEASGHPEVASLAAWVAEGRSEGVRARVLPDGTVFEAEGLALAPLAEALLAALAAREPSDDELDLARQVLTMRRRGRAPDALAELELTAASALLGPLDPLGVVGPGELAAPDDPPEDAVATFLLEHYGLERARWVVIGAIALEGAEALLGDLAGPSASRPAPRRRLSPPIRPAALEGAPAFAIAALSPPEERLGGAWGLSGSGVGERRARFVTPCGSLGLVAGRGSLDGSALAAVAFALAVGTAGAALPDADADAERAGLDFVARPERCAAPSAGARALAISAPSEADARAFAERAAVLDAATSTVEVAHADVDGRSAVVSIVLDGGAGEDPPQDHGRTALLARALAGRCGLRAEVHPEHVALEAVLDPDALDASLGRVLRCALSEPLPAASLALARSEALAALDDDARFLARAAEVLAPGAPGLVAPMGSPEGLAGAGALEEALARLRGTARLRLGVVAPTPPGERLARALAALPAGAASPQAAPAFGPEEVLHASVESDAVEVVLAWRAEGVADAAGVVALVARELAAGPLVVVHAAAGRFAGSSWMAIAVRGEAEALDAAPALAAEAARRARAGLPSRTPRPEPRDLGADPLALAHRLAAGEEPAPRIEAAEALLDAPIRRVVVRPSSGPLRRR